MSEVQVDTVAAIQEFVDLSMKRRRGALPVDSRWRLDTLEDVLRDVIDGARPAPRKIENPSAAAPAQSPAAPKVEPAKVVVTKSASEPAPEGPRLGPASPEAVPPPLPADAIQIQIAPAEPEVAVSEQDKGKIKEVDAAEVAPSGYTPSVRPCFLEDYYTLDLAMLASAPPGSPARVRSAAPGDNLGLLQEAKMLLGIGESATAPPAAPPPASVHPTVPKYVQPAAAQPTPAARPASPASAQSIAIVHLLAGGFKRGPLAGFDPGAGFVAVKAGRGDGPAEQVPLNEVLAIFFGVGRGQEPTVAAGGQRLAVKLVNDREIVGVSPDYAPGVQAMTLVPDDRRGNVDRIWVPAWSVKEIHFA